MRVQVVVDCPTRFRVERIEEIPNQIVVHRMHSSSPIRATSGQNPSPRPPPRNGEGEKDGVCSPSPCRGGGRGEGLRNRLSYLEEAGSGAPRLLQFDQGGVQPRLHRADGDA